MKRSIPTILFVSILVLLYFVVNPSDMHIMPLIEACTATLLLGAVAVYGGLFWQEKGKDEREQLITYRVGRLSFFAGVTVLATGIVVQKFMMTVDPWLAGTLAAMLFTKILSSWYLHRVG